MQSFLPAFVKRLLCAKLRSKHWGHSKQTKKKRFLELTFQWGGLPEVVGLALLKGAKAQVMRMGGRTHPTGPSPCESRPMEAWKTYLQVIAACALVSSSFKGQGSTDTSS